MNILNAIDGQSCEIAFLKSGKDPEHLAKFLKKYPAAYYLSWVKEEIMSWYAINDPDSIKKLKPGRGEGKEDSGIKQCVIDLLVYQEVTKLINKGLKLTATGGALETLTNHNFLGTFFNSDSLKRKYYRFRNRKPTTFVDGDTVIHGPARVDIGGTSCIGFWRFKPEAGEKEVIT